MPQASQQAPQSLGLRSSIERQYKHFLYVRYRAQTCRSSILKEIMVSGEGTESDLPGTILDGCVDCDHQESDPGERQSKWVIGAQVFFILS